MPKAESASTPAVEQLQKGEPGPGVPKVDPILIAHGVKRTFGGMTAVDVEHVEIPRGKITALIGPNGAGKTTFFNLLTGFDKPDTGTWSLDGDSLAGVPAYKVSRRGMVRTFQLTKALSLLSVMENMRLGATGQSGERFFPALFKAAGASGRTRSPRRRSSSSPGSSSTPRRTTTRRASPAGSASCSRWRGRS